MVEKVGIGQLRVLKGSGVLSAYGLGSCIGLFLYDRAARVGGLAHIMLPGLAPGQAGQKNKYAENAIDEMLTEMEHQGADRRRVGAVLIGGAHMFRDIAADGRESIGQKNTAGVMRALETRAIGIAAEDVGGEYGRTVEADVQDGTVRIKSYRHGSREIAWNK